jgi:hypothetical protein
MRTKKIPGYFHKGGKRGSINRITNGIFIAILHTSQKTRPNKRTQKAFDVAHEKTFRGDGQPLGIFQQEVFSKTAHTTFDDCCNYQQ